MKPVFLSHPVTAEIPVYGQRASLMLEPVKSFARGDSCEVHHFAMDNHWGTHIDGPRHFFKSGRRVADYPPSFWVFDQPQVVDVELEPADILGTEGWMDQVRPDTDLLLLRSGWSSRRETADYSERNPGLDPSVGFALRGRFPSVRVLGMDWVSASSFQNRPLGREAHRAFLDPDGENDPVLLMEDMDLSAADGLTRVTVLPLRLAEADSAPCTVLGETS